ncbi:hypothetical protein CCMA1212_009802 [Trichoderma ghanense]|uniref:Chorismate synthase n=1 Tax=Trichoderma ghanense TaxID=65468 RepID=A0ABY2GSX4_9HYPO
MSSFGHYFKVTTYLLSSRAGESHGKSVSCIIENCPPNLALTEADMFHNARFPKDSHTFFLPQFPYIDKYQPSIYPVSRAKQ